MKEGIEPKAADISRFAETDCGIVVRVAACHSDGLTITNGTKAKSSSFDHFCRNVQVFSGNGLGRCLGLIYISY